MSRLRRDRGLQADRSHVRVNRTYTWADRYDVARAIARYNLRVVLPRLRWVVVGRCWQCHIKKPLHRLSCGRR